MRVFAGISLEKSIIEQLRILQDELHGLWPGLRLTKSQNLHITLKFLGEIQKSDCLLFINDLEKAISGNKKFLLEIKGFGTFPEKHNPRIFWVGTSENRELKEIAKKTDECAAGIGIPEEKDFKTHVTIARNRERLDEERNVMVKEKFENRMWGQMTVGEVTVFQSVLKSSGPEYEVVKTITLGE